MAAQSGKNLLLKIGDGADPEVFTTVGGLRSTSITMNDEAVDVTNKDSNGSRLLLAGGGTQSLSISGSGVFTDAASETSMKTAYFAQAQTSDGSTSQTPAFNNFQVIVPDFGTFTGTFMIASMEYAGEYNGEVTYSVTLESSDYITFASV